MHALNTVEAHRSMFRENWKKSSTFLEPSQHSRKSAGWDSWAAATGESKA